MAGATRDEKAWDDFVRELGQAGSHLLLSRLHAESLCRSDGERARIRTCYEERHRELLALKALVRGLQQPDLPEERVEDLS